MSKQNENWGSKDLINYQSQRIEALRLENTRLMDENERLINSIEVVDAQLVTSDMQHYYQFMNNFNYTLKKQ
jgi:hypothetical protein